MLYLLCNDVPHCAISPLFTNGVSDVLHFASGRRLCFLPFSEMLIRLAPPGGPRCGIVQTAAAKAASRGANYCAMRKPQAAWCSEVVVLQVVSGCGPKRLTPQVVSSGGLKRLTPQGMHASSPAALATGDTCPAAQATSILGENPGKTSGL